MELAFYFKGLLMGRGLEGEFVGKEAKGKREFRELMVWNLLLLGRRDKRKG